MYDENVEERSLQLFISNDKYLYENQLPYQTTHSYSINEETQKPRKKVGIKIHIIAGVIRAVLCMKNYSHPYGKVVYDEESNDYTENEFLEIDYQADTPSFFKLQLTPIGQDAYYYITGDITVVGDLESEDSEDFYDI